MAQMLTDEEKQAIDQASAKIPGAVPAASQAPMPIPAQAPMPAIAPTQDPIAPPQTLDEAGSITSKQIQDNLKGIEAGFELKKQLEAAGAAEGVKKAAEQQSYFAKLESDQKRRAEEVAKRNEVETAQFQKAQTDFEDAKKELQGEKIDPNRYWSNMSVASKIGTMISLALGGFSEGYSGGKVKNHALDMFQNAINRDIDAQKEAISLKKGKVEDQYQLYQMMRQRFGDNQQADAAARAAAMDIAKTGIEKAAAKYSAPEIKQRAADAIATLEQQKQKHLMDFNKETLKQIEVQKQAQSQKEIIDAAKQGKLTDSEALPPEVQQRVVRLPDGTIRIADSKERAGEVNKYADEVIPAMTGAKRILDTTSSKDFSKLSLEDRAKVATELSALVGQLRLPFTGPGAMTDTEYQRLKDTIGDPNKLLTLPSVERKKLETVLNKLDIDLKGRYKRAGIETGEGSISEQQKMANPNMRRIEKLMSNNPGLTEEQAIGALRKANLYIE